MESGRAEWLRWRGAAEQAAGRQAGRQLCSCTGVHGNTPRLSKEGGEKRSSHKDAFAVKLNLGGE